MQKLEGGSTMSELGLYSVQQDLIETTQSMYLRMVRSPRLNYQFSKSMHDHNYITTKSWAHQCDLLLALKFVDCPYEVGWVSSCRWINWFAGSSHHGSQRALGKWTLIPGTWPVSKTFSHLQDHGGLHKYEPTQVVCPLSPSRSSVDCWPPWGVHGWRMRKMCVKSFKLQQVCSLQCPPVSAIDWGMSSTMIQSEISTSPISTPYGFSKHIKSPPLSIWPSPPASPFTSSPPSLGYTSENLRGLYTVFQWFQP